jgi:hypothetical protein
MRKGKYFFTENINLKKKKFKNCILPLIEVMNLNIDSV